MGEINPKFKDEPKAGHDAYAPAGHQTSTFSKA